MTARDSHSPLLTIPTSKCWFGLSDGKRFDICIRRILISLTITASKVSSFHFSALLSSCKVIKSHHSWLEDSSKVQGSQVQNRTEVAYLVHAPRFFLPLLLFVLLPVAENLLHSGLIQGLNPIVAPYFVFYSNSDRAPNGEMSFGCVRGSGKIRKRGHSLYLRPNWATPKCFWPRCIQIGPACWANFVPKCFQLVIFILRTPISYYPSPRQSKENHPKMNDKQLLRYFGHSNWAIWSLLSWFCFKMFPIFDPSY